MGKIKRIGGFLKDGTVIHYGFAAALSFRHIHDLAATHGQSGWGAWCYPPAVDLLIYAGYRRIKSGHGAAAGWFAFLFGTLVSLGANIVESYLTTHSALGVAIGLYPSLGMLVATLLSHSDAASAPVPAAADEPEMQEEHGGERVALHLVEHDTPEPVEQESGDTPWDELPEQGAPGFYPAVVALVSADQPVNTFPNGSAFCQAVIDALVRHGYRPVHSMTIRRAMNSKPKKAA